MTAVLPDTSTNAHRGSSAHMHPGKILSGFAADLGEAVDVIAENPSRWGGQEAALISLNADLIRSSYVNAMFCQSTDGSKYPSAWYMKNASGSKLVSKGYGNYMMEPRRPASYTDGLGTFQTWAEYVVAKSLDVAVDAVFLDMQGPAPMLTGYLKSINGVGSAVPHDYQTGRDFTTASYLSVAHDVSQAVKDAGVYVISNGIGNGKQFYKTPTRGLLSNVDVGFAEVWMRSPSMLHTAWPTEAEWAQEVQALIDAQLVDLGALWTMTKFWRTESQTGLATAAYNAIVTQWRRFCYCSHLLGGRGSSIFEFSRLESDPPATDDDVYYHVDLGAPNGMPPTVAGLKKLGVYRRGYANGWVLVNPTSGAVSLTATPDGRSYVQPGSGTAITLPIKVEAHSGRILSISGFES